MTTIVIVALIAVCALLSLGVVYEHVKNREMKDRLLFYEKRAFIKVGELEKELMELKAILSNLTQLKKAA